MDFILWKKKINNAGKSKKKNLNKNINNTNDTNDINNNQLLNQQNEYNNYENNNNPCYQIVIRHFKTYRNKINYKNNYDEARPYVSMIKKYIDMNGIKEIFIYTSPQERTIITSLVLHMYLRDFQNVTVHKPKINDNLDRDPNKKNISGIYNYFYNYSKNHSSQNKKLFIHVTHSSVYSAVFLGLLCGTNNECPNSLEHLVNNKRIHSHSISWIKYFNGKMDFDFNIKME